MARLWVCDINCPEVSVDILAKQGDLTHPFFRKFSNLSDDILEWPGDFGAACVGHNTETAVLAAAFHDGNKCGGAFYACRREMIEFFNFGKTNINLRLLGASPGFDEFRQPMQGLRAKDNIDVGRPLDDRLTFLRSHASAHTDN